LLGNRGLVVHRLGHNFENYCESIVNPICGRNGVLFVGLRLEGGWGVADSRVDLVWIYYEVCVDLLWLYCGFSMAWY
jgi:hypothetical protein